MKDCNPESIDTKKNTKVHVQNDLNMSLNACCSKSKLRHYLDAQVKFCKLELAGIINNVYNVEKSCFPYLVLLPSFKWMHETW